jgi:hypothetical protein
MEEQPSNYQKLANSFWFHHLVKTSLPQNLRTNGAIPTRSHQAKGIQKIRQDVQQDRLHSLLLRVSLETEVVSRS